MRPIAYVVALAAALFCLVSCAVSPQPQADAVVKIVTERGHGSAFHAGNGYIVTAAHVVRAAKEVEVKTSSGDTRAAEVLWSNLAYDVALLHIEDADGIAASPLACRTPKVGERIIAKGNPGDQDFVTVHGRIAGSERPYGHWRKVVVTDIATAPGQSGGPVYDDSGAVVGITVGVMLAHVGFSGSLVGIGYVVSGATICEVWGI